jgi:hypothetical protein
MESEKTSRKPKRIALVLIVITLAANAVLTGINVYLIVQSNQNLSNLEFESSMPSSTFFIIARADDASLGKPAIYFSQEGAIEQTIHYGTAYVTVQVATPHYGTLTIRLKGFHVTESEYLDSEKRNETEISYSDGKESQVYILAPGLNQISAQLPLKAQVYPKSEKLPPKGEPVKVSLGYLSLEAESFDFETQTRATSEFSAEIFIELEMPP